VPVRLQVALDLQHADAEQVRARAGRSVTSRLAAPLREHEDHEQSHPANEPKPVLRHRSRV